MTEIDFSSVDPIRAIALDHAVKIADQWGEDDVLAAAEKFYAFLIGATKAEGPETNASVYEYAGYSKAAQVVWDNGIIVYRPHSGRYTFSIYPRESTILDLVAEGVLRAPKREYVPRDVEVSQ
jgi:hypothetical protein